MLIGHSMPAVTGVTLTGATWLTADQGDALHDGKPARVARLSSAGSAAIKLAFATAFKPRVIAVLGMRGVAPGTPVRATGPGALGGNAGTAVATQLPDGTVAAWIVTAGTVTTAEITITISAAGVIDVGEVVAMPAVEIPIDAGWSEMVVDPTELSRSRGSQVAQIGRSPFRSLPVTFSLAPDPAVRFGGLGDGMDWSRLSAALAGKRRCVAIPRGVSRAGLVDEARMPLYALYGIAAELGAAEHMRGPFWRQTVRFEEIPAAV